MRQNGQYSPLSNGLVGIFHGLDLLLLGHRRNHAISANLPPASGRKATRRRAFIAALGGAAAWPVVARNDL